MDGRPRIIEVTPKSDRQYTPADIDMASGRDLGMISWPNQTPGRSSRDRKCPSRSSYGHRCILPAPHMSYCTAVIDSGCPEKVLNR